MGGISMNLEAFGEKIKEKGKSEEEMATSPKADPAMIHIFECMLDQENTSAIDFSLFTFEDLKKAHELLTHTASIKESENIYDEYEEDYDYHYVAPHPIAIVGGYNRVYNIIRSLFTKSQKFGKRHKRKFI